MAYSTSVLDKRECLIATAQRAVWWQLAPFCVHRWQSLSERDINIT